MLDPLESAFAEICTLHGIRFTRPEQIAGGHGPHGSLDFHLTDYGLSVELKAWSCERMVRQLYGKQGVMVLIGLSAVEAFGKLLKGTINMKITLTNRASKSLVHKASDIEHGKFFRANSTAFPKENSVFIRLLGIIYRVDDDASCEDLINHCSIQSTVTFTELYYLKTELIGEDRNQ